MPKDIFARSSGVLLHITSLPGPHGIGDLGPAAAQFIDDLNESGQTWWQMLPVTPLGYGDSPYNALSAFAGNPFLISLEKLVEDGWLQPGDLAGVPPIPEGPVEFDRVKHLKEPLFRKAFARFRAAPGSEKETEAFCRRQGHWIHTWSLYMALKNSQQGRSWSDWPEEIRPARNPALEKVKTQFKEEISYQIFLQLMFRRQWNSLRHHAAKKKVKLLGDIPIFVAHDSADVWSHRGLFKLDPDGRSTEVAGVPPDYFSPTGQRWGNPLYNWPVHRKDGFAWWIYRIEAAFDLFDAVRLDHFIGFYRAWEIPASEQTAVNGRWAPGPRDHFFNAVKKALQKPALIAEDLGNIIPPITRLRKKFDFPGMFVLHFAFGDGIEKARARLKKLAPRTVVYTGTHDNDTTVGWFRSQGGGTPNLSPELRTAMEIMESDGREIHWDLIRLALSSEADLAIVPLQDLLGLDSSARMNLPGTTGGNWSWRLRTGQLTPSIKERTRKLTEDYDRRP